MSEEVNNMERRLEDLKLKIKSYPDFPKPGILFRDIFSILSDPNAFSELRKLTIEYIKSTLPYFDVIVGLESRGFLIGPFLALEFCLPFVPVRKQGKLPGELAKAVYALEYGNDTFEIQKDVIKPHQRVLIVDDLLATGGSLSAAFELVTSLGAEVIGSLVVMELTDLKGRDKVSSPVHSLIKF